MSRFYININEQTREEKEMIVGWCMVYIIIMYFFYQMLKYIHDKRMLINAYDKLKQVSENRQIAEENLMIAQGNREHVDVLTQIDILLIQCGLRQKIHFLTTEIFIALDIVVGTICFISILKISESVIFGMAAFVIGAALPYIAMNVSAMSKAKMMEDDMGVFLDMIDAYAKSSDDIVDIMGNVYPSLHEPLRGYVEEFYFEAIGIGDKDTAFRHLKYKIPHKKLREIIGNLQLCSTKVLDYHVIVKDSEEQLRTYLDGKRDRQDARTDGGMQMVIFAVIVIGGFYIMGLITEMDILEFLTSNILGKIIILYYIIIAIAALYVTFAPEKE